MANRRKNDYLDYEEMKWMLDQTIFCCCPECGSECIVDSIDHGKNLSGRSVQFTCGKCGSFTADRDIKKGEWKIRGSDLLYLPCTEGNDFTLYQRFDESSYPSRSKALGKIGMSDMTVDEAIVFLNGCIMERRHPVF